MARLDDVLKRREEIAFNAGKRWMERAPERQDALIKAARLGPAAADSPERVNAFREMLRRRAGQTSTVEFIQERIIGPTLDFTDRPSDEASRRAGRPVGRVVEIMGKGVQPKGFGTGFLVAPGVLMTNNHVLPGEGYTAGVGVNFGYERGVEGINEGEIFELDPGRLFYSNQALDFALVAVKSSSLTGEELEKFGYHKLISQTGKILIGQPINIIQYPEGGPKKYAVSQNKLMDVFESYLHYETDTLPGSSGSPTFSEFWEVVSLHHSGVPDMRDGRILDRRGQFWDKNTQTDDDINWIANEGVRVSSIMNFLKTVMLPHPDQQTLMMQVFEAPVADISNTSTEARISNSLSTKHFAGASMADNLASAVINISGNTTINIGGTQAAHSAGATQKESVAVERRAVFDPDYGNRTGYHPGFLLGHDVPLPGIASARLSEIYTDRRHQPLILDYHHYSVVMNKERRLQMWCAANVNYDPRMKAGKDRKELGDGPWSLDPRVPASLQLSEAEFYGPARKFDRGHMVRREDGAWGATLQEILYANADTFHLTNCTPQHESFNRSNLNGTWGNLENHVTRQAPTAGERYNILAGPILDNAHDLIHDWGGGTVQIPLEFWKIIVVAEDDKSRYGTLRAYGFMLEQASNIKKKGLEAFDVGEFGTYQRSLQEISDTSGVIFDEMLMKADVMAETPAEPPSKRRIRETKDIRRQKG